MIVGEAVVERDFVSEFSEEDGFTYKGFVKFSPSSIRIYVGFLAIETLGELAGEKISRAKANACLKIDWAVYPKILSEVVKRGFYC